MSISKHFRGSYNDLRTTILLIWHTLRWICLYCMEDGVEILKRKFKATLVSIEAWFQQQAHYTKSLEPVGSNQLIYFGQLDGYLWVSMCLLANSIARSVATLFSGIFMTQLNAYWCETLGGFAIGYFAGLPSICEEERQVVALLGCTLNGVFNGLSSEADSTLSWNVHHCLALTLSICAASVLYNKLLGDAPRVCFVLASLLPGAAVCFLVDPSADTTCLFGLFVLAAWDYQINLSRLKEGSIMTPSDRLFTVSVYSNVCFLCGLKLATMAPKSVRLLNRRESTSNFGHLKVN